MKKRASQGARSGAKGSPSMSHPFRKGREKDGAPIAPSQPTGAQRDSPLVQIEKPVYGGAFLARVEGKAVFVPLALPQERARVRIVEEKRGYATAEVEEIVAAAPERVVPACGHFGACGGCQYQHAEYAGQIVLKLAILRETLERGGLGAPEKIAVLAGEPWAYRNRIRVAFDAEGHAGYRGRRSHAVVRIAECPIAAPLLVRAALAAGEIARGLAPRSRPHEISLFCDAEETALLASLTFADGGNGRIEEFARVLAESIPESKGVELLSQGGNGQEARSVAQWGVNSLLYRAAGFAYRVDHGAFFQVNRWLVDALVECVTGGHHGGLAWDLFAGVGLFARRLAGQFGRVVAVESAPAAMAALKQNLAGTSATPVPATALEFLRGARKVKRPDVMVVDPPRTGLGAETTALLGQIEASTLVYVSCDPATLARDLRALVGAGYAIEHITLADLFPQTFHLETVVHLRR